MFFFYCLHKALSSSLTFLPNRIKHTQSRVKVIAISLSFSSRILNLCSFNYLPMYCSEKSFLEKCFQPWRIFWAFQKMVFLYSFFFLWKTPSIHHDNISAVASILSSPSNEIMRFLCIIYYFFPAASLEREKSKWKWKFIHFATFREEVKKHANIRQKNKTHLSIRNKKTE